MDRNSVLLENRLASFTKLTDYDEANDVLKYRKPGWEYTPAGALYIRWKAGVAKGVEDCDPNEPRGWDGYIKMLKGQTVGTGVVLAMQDKLKEAMHGSLTINDHRTKPDYGWFIPTDKDRDYQIACIEAMMAAKTGGLILNATGTGKTYIAGKYFSLLKGAGLFIVDELTLLEQAINEIGDVCRDNIGEVGNGVFRPARITVATVQTLFLHREDARFWDWMRSLQAVIIDEIHVALNARNFGVIQTIQPDLVFGLTATLELKKKHIAMRAYDLAGPVLFEYPLEQGVKDKVLSKGLAVSVQLRQDYKSAPALGYTFWQRMRKHMANYRLEYEKLIVGSLERNNWIVDCIEEAHQRNKYVLCLVERIQHIKNLEALLNKRKIEHHLVYGAKKADERIDSKKRFEAGEIRVLIGNKVFKKGVNIKRVDVVIDAAAMKSRNDAVQKYGRGVRLCDLKEGLIYIDIADQGNRFEKSSKIRRAALKKIGVHIYKASAATSAGAILDLAERKLKVL